MHRARTTPFTHQALRSLTMMDMELWERLEYLQRLNAPALQTPDLQDLRRVGRGDQVVGPSWSRYRARVAP